MEDRILASILTIMNDTSLSESFFESVLKRLDSFGYIVKDTDSWSLCFAIQKTENHIKNSCNTTEVPEGLFNVAVDMVCGEFLLAKNQTGNLDIAGLDLDGAVTSIKEGDVQINFDSASSDEDKFNTLVNILMNEGDLICYRKIKW